MRYKKTPQSERRTYKVFDGQGKMVAELKPDENGVTADMIKKLHVVDDHEVYVNCKELRLPPYLEECYREWRQRYISQYIQEHGSHPKTDEITTAHRQLVYLDEIRELPESNVAVQLALSHYYDDEPSDPVLLLRELVAQMPQRWQEVYRLAMLMEYSNVETAEILGVTEARIRALKKKITERIRCDENLKKYFP